MAHTRGIVVAKTGAKNAAGQSGICFAVVDSTGQLVRPISTRGPAAPFWSMAHKAIGIGTRVEWENTDEPPISAFPHRTEDVLSLSLTALDDEVDGVHALLMPLKTDFATVWPPSVRAGSKAILAGAQVPSLLVIEGSIGHITVHGGKVKANLDVGEQLLQGVHVASLYCQQPENFLSVQNCQGLLVLGLARPNATFNVPSSLEKCQIILLGCAPHPIPQQSTCEARELLGSVFTFRERSGDPAQPEELMECLGRFLAQSDVELCVSPPERLRLNAVKEMIKNEDHRLLLHPSAGCAVVIYEPAQGSLLTDCLLWSVLTPTMGSGRTYEVSGSSVMTHSQTERMWNTVCRAKRPEEVVGALSSMCGEHASAMHQAMGNNARLTQARRCYYVSALRECV